MTRLTLHSTIYRYRGEWSIYLANCIDADTNGQSDEDVPRSYEAYGKIIEEWSLPAEHASEALLALQLALEDYESGDTPRIPAMIKAAIGWVENEMAMKRRGAQ